MAKATTLDARSVDPNTLVIAANVRTETKIDKTFVASIKQHGVLVPIAAEDRDGILEVIDGQRRTLAAIEAGLTVVPVIVGGGISPDAERIIEQLVVNEHRADLDDREETNAFGQLALLGVPASAIAKKTNLPVKRVQLAVDVAASPTAGQAMVEHELTLDQAAIILEFEDDPADVAKLTASVKTGQFDHTASEIRDRRKRTALLTQGIAALAEEGLPYWDKPLGEYWERGTKTLPIERLSAGKKRLTAQAHAECPGRAFAITVGYGWVGQTREIQSERVEICINFEKHGHTNSYFSGSSASSQVKPDKDSPEAAAATALRRLVIANNKAFQPATEVRLAFIRDLLQRNDLPADWELYVANHFSTQYTPAESRDAAKKLLGIADAESLGTWLQAAPRKAPQLLIAIALAWTEERPEFAKTGWRSSYAKAHLVQLSKWGYTLSELEERVVAGTAETVA